MEADFFLLLKLSLGNLFGYLRGARHQKNFSGLFSREPLIAKTGERERTISAEEQEKRISLKGTKRIRFLGGERKTFKMLEIKLSPAPRCCCCCK